MGRSACVNDSLMAKESLFMEIPEIGDFFCLNFWQSENITNLHAGTLYESIRDILILKVLFSESESFIVPIKSLKCNTQGTRV